MYRLGGSSVDATLIAVNSGMYRIIGSKVDHDFGGYSFDQVLVNLFMQEFHRYVSSMLNFARTGDKPAPCTSEIFSKKHPSYLLPKSLANPGGPDSSVCHRKHYCRRM